MGKCQRQINQVTKYIAHLNSCSFFCAAMLNVYFKMEILNSSQQKTAMKYTLIVHRFDLVKDGLGNMTSSSQISLRHLKAIVQDM